MPAGCGEGGRTCVSACAEFFFSAPLATDAAGFLVRACRTPLPNLPKTHPNTVNLCELCVLICQQDTYELKPNLHTVVA